MSNFVLIFWRLFKYKNTLKLTTPEQDTSYRGFIEVCTIRIFKVFGWQESENVFLFIYTLRNPLSLQFFIIQ